MAVSDACGGADVQVLDNIVHYASSELHTVLMADYDGCRVGYLAQAEELTHFAKSVELDTRSTASFEKDVVTHVTESKPRSDTRMCYGCGKIGYIHLFFPDERKRTRKKNGANRAWRHSARTKDVVNYTLSVQDVKAQDKLWILDSGSSWHLINYEALFDNASECDYQCFVNDGKISTNNGRKCGTSREGMGRASVTRLTEVYYASLLTRNIVSNGKMEPKFYGLQYEGDRQAVISITTGDVVFDLAMHNDVLILETQDEKVDVGMDGAVMAAIDVASEQIDDEVVHAGTLMHFHQRFGHLTYDNIERMAREPVSGILLTDKTDGVYCMCTSKAVEERAAQEGHWIELANQSRWWCDLFVY